MITKFITFFMLPFQYYYFIKIVDCFLIKRMDII